jgi:NADH dehydrogenase (ubiquinone) 1 alpha subcomplex subunit 13
MWSRIHLIPMLQAEEDRDQVRRHLADKAREKQLLGTETKVYNTDRYDIWCRRELVPEYFNVNGFVCRNRFVRPTFAYTPSKVTQ